MFRSCLVFVAFAAVGVSAGGDCSASSGPDSCASGDSVNLNDANGNFLRKICITAQTATWADAQTFCKSIGYTLFRIDSSAVADSFNQLVVSSGISDLFLWINGRTVDRGWVLVDPNGPYPFMTVSTTNGACLSYRFESRSGFFYQGDDCETVHNFACEKQGC